MDPDCSSSRRGIKRLRSMNSAKESGNQAFKQQKWEEAYDQYSQAIDLDPQLQSSFMVQCLCNRFPPPLPTHTHSSQLITVENFEEKWRTFGMCCMAGYQIIGGGGGGA
jgi:hypothetical protein